jgi:hypothetical protein
MLAMASTSRRCKFSSTNWYPGCLIYLATKSCLDFVLSPSWYLALPHRPNTTLVAWIGSIRTFVAKDFRLKISGGDLMLSASDPSVNIHRENSAGHAGMLFMISGSPIFFRSVKHCLVSRITRRPWVSTKIPDSRRAGQPAFPSDLWERLESFQ